MEKNFINTLDKVLDELRKNEIMVYELYIYYSLQEDYSYMELNNDDKEFIVHFLYDYWVDYGINNLYDIMELIINNLQDIKDNKFTKEDIWNKF